MAKAPVSIMGTGPTNSMVNITESKNTRGAKAVGIGPTINVVTNNGD